MGNVSEMRNIVMSKMPDYEKDFFEYIKGNVQSLPLLTERVNHPSDLVERVLDYMKKTREIWRMTPSGCIRSIDWDCPITSLAYSVLGKNYDLNSGVISSLEDLGYRARDVRLSAGIIIGAADNVSSRHHITEVRNRMLEVTGLKELRLTIRYRPSDWEISSAF